MAVQVTFIPNPLLEQEWNRSEAAYGMMTGIGERILGLAVSFAPVDTGDLARSIEMALGADGAGHPEVAVGTNIRYGGFVEFGTSIPTPEQPYLRPALDEAI